jgi:hypothetical protein
MVSFTGTRSLFQPFTPYLEGIFLLSPKDHETLSLYPNMDAFALFPTSEDEHISSGSKIAETQHPDSLGGFTCTDYSNDSPPPITSEIKMVSDVPIIEASAAVDIPRRPQSASNPSTSSHRAHSESILSDNLNRHQLYHITSVGRHSAYIQNHLVPRMSSSSDCDKAAPINGFPDWVAHPDYLSCPTGQTTSDNMYVFACGGYGDVWKGTLWDGVGTRKVPISKLYSTTLSQMFCLGCNQGLSTTDRS